MPGWPLSEEAFDIEYGRVAQIVNDRQDVWDYTDVLAEMSKIHGRWVWQAAEEYRNEYR